MVQDRGIVSYLQLLTGELGERAQERRQLSQRLEEDLGLEFPSVFFRAEVVKSIHRGAPQVAQSYGIGHLEANTVLFGWQNKRERALSYFQMMRSFACMHRSVLLLRQNPERGFARHRSIHVWWRGLQGNGGLMLLLAQLISSHSRWSQSEIKALTVVEGEEERIQAKRALLHILEDARIDASPCVLLREGRSVSEIMSEESGAADLLLLGLRLPESDEEVLALHEYYNKFLEGLPSALLVHSGPDFDSAPVLFDE